MTFAIVSGIMFFHWRYISIPECFLSGVYTDSQQCHWCVFSALDTHIWCVTHILPHIAQRSLSERMHVCHCCVLPLPTLLICHSLYHSFRFFINLHSTCRTNGQKIGFYCLALRSHNYTFSRLATEWHWNVACEQNTEQQCHRSGFWHTEVAHMSARVMHGARCWILDSYHIFSIGYKSGLIDRNGRSITWFYWSQAVVTLYLCFWPSFFFLQDPPSSTPPIYILIWVAFSRSFQIKLFLTINISV